MPGTVQVSILELTGLPSSKSASSMTIKVSLGKHTYEAEGEKADFLFPLVTLRDNLVVKVHDTEGIEIAHTGVKSRLIAEKGSWDDLFPFEGGGLVHMKLKFSLSEEERNRIRNMRESALRKKQEELLNKNNRDLQAAVASSGGGNETTSTSAISDKVHSFDLPLEASSKVVSFKSSSTPSNLKERSSLEKTSSSLKEDDQRYNLTEQIPLEKTPAKLKEDDQRYNLKEQIPLEKTPVKLKEDDQPYNFKELSPLEKTPSKLKEDDQPYNFKEQIPLEKTPKRLKEDDQRFNLKEQIPLEKTPAKLKEDDQPYKFKEQSPLEKTPNRLKEDDQSYNLSEQIPLEKTPSKLKEDDQAYDFKEQSPLEKTPSRLKEDDQCYDLKEQIPLEEIPRKLKEDGQPYNLKEQSPLEKTPSKAKKDYQPYNFKEQSPLEKAPCKVKDDERYNLKEQNPLEKTASKVRETIAAFESSRLTQGQMTTEKAQSGREITDAYSKDERGPIENSSTLYEPKDVDNMEYKSKDISDEKEPKGKYPLHYIVESQESESSKELRRSSNLEQYRISGRDHDSLLDESQPSNSVTEQEYASDAPFLSDIQMANHLNNPPDRMSAEVSGRRRRCSCHNFHGWIFLEEAICSCIVGDKRMVIDLLGDYSVNPNTYPGQLVGEEVTSSKDDKLSSITKKPESSLSSGDGASRGPNGKVLKIVIMVGFGLLVLFTKKSKSR